VLNFSLNTVSVKVIIFALSPQDFSPLLSCHAYAALLVPLLQALLVAFATLPLNHYSVSNHLPLAILALYWCLAPFVPFTLFPGFSLFRSSHAGSVPSRVSNIVFKLTTGCLALTRS